MRDQYFIAVRMSDEKEFFDTTTISGSLHIARTLAKVSGVEGWRKDNPIVRFSEIQISEVGGDRWKKK